MTMKKLRIEALVMSALLTLGACGAPTLNDTRLEEVISEGIETQAGLTVTSIDCPADRPLLLNDKFDCTATTADGRTLTIGVTQTDSTGQVHWEITGES